MQSPSEAALPDFIRYLQFESFCFTFKEGYDDIFHIIGNIKVLKGYGCKSDM